MKHEGIHRALKDGHAVHAFLSGGGLRVVRVESRQDGALKGYGEHPHVEQALAYADEDYLAGGRPYGCVYGGQREHYLTGSLTPSSVLDRWILQGRTFDCWQDGETVTFRLKAMREQDTPEAVNQRLLNEGGTMEWQARGYRYRSSRVYYPGNGTPCVRTEVIEGPANDRDPWMYYVTKTGTGKDFGEAMTAAFAAPEVEISRQEGLASRPAR